MSTHCDAGNACFSTCAHVDSMRLCFFGYTFKYDPLYFMPEVQEEGWSGLNYMGLKVCVIISGHM